jgi:hypothetical protein
MKLILFMQQNGTVAPIKAIFALCFERRWIKVVAMFMR